MAAAVSAWSTSTPAELRGGDHARDQRDPRAAIAGRLADRATHRAGAAVADEPGTQFDRLRRPTRRDHHVAAGQVVRVPPGFVCVDEARGAIGGVGLADRARPDRIDRRVDDLRRGRPGDRCRPGRGRRPGFRLHDPVAELVAEDPHVRLRRRMGVHVPVHRRWATTTGADVARQVAGDDVGSQPVRHRAQPVGGGGRHDDHVRRIGGDHVADPTIREEIQDVRVHGGDRAQRA